MLEKSELKLCVFLAVMALLQVIQVTVLADDDLDGTAGELQAWADFKAQYNKTYATPDEENRRRLIFLDNKRYIESFDTKETGAGFVPGINPLCDLTTDEINQSRNGFRVSDDMPEEFSGSALLEHLLQAFNQSAQDRFGHMDLDDRAWLDELLTAPSLDFRYRGIVSRVKDQGSCGSCWAFATTGALESALAQRGRKILLSEQNLVDCSTRYGNNGCMGGLMDAAFRYVRDHGIMSAQDYPYEAKDSECRARADRVITRVQGSSRLPRGNESLLRLALSLRGPIPVAIDASHRSFHTYKSGIYDERRCKSNMRGLNHAVLLIGYGTESGRDYWLLKNSWGRSWGDNGYIKIARNQRNVCGVATYAIVPRL